MGDVQYRFSPYELTTTAGSFTASYDPGIFDDLSSNLRETQEVEITFPDGNSYCRFVQSIEPGEPYEVLDGRWQEFKARWFPRFLLRRFPVRTVWQMDCKIVLGDEPIKQ